MQQVCSPKCVHELYRPSVKDAGPTGEDTAHQQGIWLNMSFYLNSCR
jgi:hypothetical protein